MSALSWNPGAFPHAACYLLGVMDMFRSKKTQRQVSYRWTNLRLSSGNIVSERRATSVRELLCAEAA
jgi:hypothetical protein